MEIIHSTKCTLQGPWLIGRETLEELDEIVESEWSRLAERRDKMIETEVNESVAKDMEKKYRREDYDENAERSVRRTRLGTSYAYSTERTITIDLRDNRRVTAQSFDEAFRDPALFEA